MTVSPFIPNGLEWVMGRYVAPLIMVWFSLRWLTSVPDGHRYPNAAAATNQGALAGVVGAVAALGLISQHRLLTSAAATPEWSPVVWAFLVGLLIAVVISLLDAKPEALRTALKELATEADQGLEELRSDERPKKNGRAEDTTPQKVDIKNPKQPDASGPTRLDQADDKTRWSRGFIVFAATSAGLVALGLYYSFPEESLIHQWLMWTSLSLLLFYRLAFLFGGSP